MRFDPPPGQDSYSRFFRSESSKESISSGYDWRGWSSVDNDEEEDAVRQYSSRNPIEVEYTERFLAADLRRRVQLTCLPENSTWLSWGRGGASYPKPLLVLGSAQLFAAPQYPDDINPACFPGMPGSWLASLSETVSECTPKPSIVGPAQAGNRLAPSHTARARHFVENFVWN